MVEALGRNRRRQRAWQLHLIDRDRGQRAGPPPAAPGTVLHFVALPAAVAPVLLSGDLRRRLVGLDQLVEVVQHGGGRAAVEAAVAGALLEDALLGERETVVLRRARRRGTRGREVTPPRRRRRRRRVFCELERGREGRRGRNGRRSRRPRRAHAQPQRRAVGALRGHVRGAMVRFHLQSARLHVISPTSQIQLDLR